MLFYKASLSDVFEHFEFQKLYRGRFEISKLEVVLGSFDREVLAEDVKDLRIRPSSSILTILGVDDHPSIMCWSFSSSVRDGRGSIVKREGNKLLINPWVL